MLLGDKDLYRSLKIKADWVRKETLKIHAYAQDTRIASSLSAVELFTVLYYGKLLKFKSSQPLWDKRDRFIISKGHGAISLYPILADLRFFPKDELKKVCCAGSFLGGIPDPVIPGFETVNGSLGHGLGVGCGMALGLKNKERKERVFVLVGDGELYEGSVWEAVMLAGEYRLNNLVCIVDNNKVCMLDYCKKIIDLEPLEEKFKAFGWAVKRVNGHDTAKLHKTFSSGIVNKRPTVIIADTVKGKGVKRLETDSLSHIKNVSPQEVEALLKEKP